VVAVALLSACGARQAQVEAPVAPPGELETYMAKVRRLSEEARPLPAAVATVEAADPRLAAALLAATARPVPATFRLVASEYRRLGIFDRAHEYLNRALRLDTQDAATLDLLARLWRDGGMPHLALGDAYRAVHYAPDSPAARNTLGTVFQALGRNDLARAEYERALRHDPSAAYAFNNLCYSWVLDARGPEAVTACRAALSAQPGLVAAGNNLGLALALTGGVEAAADAFDAAGDLASARYNEGIVLLATGRYSDALEAFTAARRARPSFRLAESRMRQVLGLLETGVAR
jgi:tetratricopeptide (TPR) repeat protein